MSLARKSLVSGIAAAALAAPTAIAVPIQDPSVHLTAQEQQAIAARGQGAPIVSAQPIVQPSDDSGFEWRDAGAGAGLVLVAVGSLAVARRRRFSVVR